MPNHPTVTTLVDLARADLSIVHAKKKIRDLREHADRLNEESISAESNLVDAQNALANLRQLEVVTQQKLETYRNRRKTAIRALEEGLGDPESAQRQVIQCGEIIDELEFELLECFENRIHGHPNHVSPKSS